MKTASLVFLQETADDLRHEIKIQTVYICDPKNVLWLLVLDLACLQPQLLPLTRKRDKTLSCIGKLQCARTFFTVPSSSSSADRRWLSAGCDTNSTSAALDKDELDTIVRNVLMSW